MSKQIKKDMQNPSWVIYIKSWIQKMDLLAAGITGLFKPSGGFELAPALCALGAVFGMFQFLYYSDDSKRIDPWAKPDK